jgi:hypothetical protein
VCLPRPYTTRRKAAYVEKKEKEYVQNPEKALRVPFHAVITQPCMKQSQCLGIPALGKTMTSLPALQIPAQQIAPSLGKCDVTRKREKNN